MNGWTSDWRGDAAGALFCATLALGIAALSGFAGLAVSGGDNDSLLRLVQVRDLISGQGWFDLRQYRMGPEGGFLMHWSRIVDAPIAGIILLARALGATAAQAEAMAGIVWPLGLYALALFLTGRILAYSAPPSARLPGLAIAAVTLHATGQFQPGMFDHHAAQLTLALFVLGALLRPHGSRFFAGIAAGGSAALMLAIGAETVPYVAAFGLIAALLTFSGDAEELGRARGFGLGFAGVAAAAFAATVPPAAWGEVRCDAYSVAGFGVAALSGLGLAGIATLHARTTVFRLAALAGLALAVFLLVVLAFPECLADPYARLDPRLHALWLDGVTEAQPFGRLLARDPALLLGYYATPLLGLAVLALKMGRAGVGRGELMLFAVLGVAFLVSLWQVRGAYFSLPLAVIPLAAWVGRLRDRAIATPAPRLGSLRMAAAWLASISLAWSGVASAAGDLARRDIAPDPSVPQAECLAESDFDALGALPQTTVLAISNLGSSILRHTVHRALAGPYHRNVAGNLAALNAELAPPDEAETLVRATGARIVAVCPGNGETDFLAEREPTSVLAALARGDVPPWLKPLPHDGPLRLFELTPPSLKPRS